jgi:hypothetical protein
MSRAAAIAAHIAELVSTSTASRKDPPMASAYDIDDMDIAASRQRKAMVEQFSAAVKAIAEAPPVKPEPGDYRPLSTEARERILAEAFAWRYDTRSDRRTIDRFAPIAPGAKAVLPNEVHYFAPSTGQHLGPIAAVPAEHVPMMLAVPEAWSDLEADLLRARWAPGRPTIWLTAGQEG